jgi:hypothetical protein
MAGIARICTKLRIAAGYASTINLLIELTDFPALIYRIRIRSIDHRRTCRMLTAHGRSKNGAYYGSATTAYCMTNYCTHASAHCGIGLLMCSTACQGYQSTNYKNSFKHFKSP